MLENFIFNKSLPKIFVRKLIGVNTKKYTAAITIGAIILPNSSPNFTHSLFKGVNILEFNNPNIKKIIAIGKKIILGLFPYINGHKPIMRKTKKKTIPKPLLFSLDFINIFNLRIHIF